MGRRGYPPEFRRKVLDLVEAGRPIAEVANAIFEYLEIFHNRQRRHSSLGMLSPIEFETHQPATVA
jgi:transposase InsO family protein